MTKALSLHRFRGASLLTLACLIGLGPANALAAPTAVKGSSSSASPQKQAEEAFYQALTLFDQGKFEQALTDFERAHRLVPNFSILYNIGLVKLELDDLEGAYAALADYVKIGGSRIPSDQLAAVLDELERLKPRLSSLKIEVDDPSAEVTLDGEVITAERLRDLLYINPGQRTVAVRFNDELHEERLVDSRAGQHTVVRFEAPMIPAPVDEPATPERRIESSSRDDKTGADTPQFPWLPWAITGVLGAGGATLGVLTLRERTNEKALRDSPGTTRSELERTHTNVKQLALATDVTLGLAALGALASIYWTVEWSKDKERAEVRASVVPTINGIRIEGTF